MLAEGGSGVRRTGATACALGAVLGATACFLAGAGRGFGTACAVAEGGPGGGDGAATAPVDGSGVMMLTGGIDADDGKSALVGLPVGSDASADSGGDVPGSAASAVAAGALHDGA